VLAVSCSAGTHDQPESASTVDETPPSGTYLLVYAMNFVEAMRKSDKRAGAYEVSRRPDDNGIYTVGIDVFEGTAALRLIILLKAKDGGLEPLSAKLDEQSVYPNPGGDWVKFSEWHASADARARVE